jgi:MFS family permease
MPLASYFIDEEGDGMDGSDAPAVARGEHGGAEGTGGGAGEGARRAVGRSSGTLVVVVLCAVQFVDVLGVTVVVTALPSMLAGLEAPPSAAAPVLTGYAVLFGALLMLGARLGDRYGHRRVLLAGLALFGAASVLAASATGVPVLVLARCLQGAAAAVSVPPALRLLTAATPDGPARRRALAAWSAAGAAAGASGFLLGGALTDVFGWRSVFWVNAPLAALLLIAVRRLAPCLPPHRSGPLDWAGAAVLTVAVAALVLGGALLETPTHRLAGLLAVALGGGLLVVLTSIERRVRSPLIPGAAARHPALRTGVTVSFLNTATTSSVVLASLYLQDERGLGPTSTGLMLLPFSLSVVLGAAAAAPALRRATPRAVAGAGLATIAAGNAALLTVPQAVAALPAAVAVGGVGIGLSSVAATKLGTSVPEALEGTAAGALNTTAQLGNALGLAAILLIATTTTGTSLPLAGASLGWACAAAVAALAAAVLLSRHRGRLAEPT